MSGIIAGAGLTLLYIGVLYAGSDHRRGRNDPAVIRRRSLAVLAVCAVSWLPARYGYPRDDAVTLAARLGLRSTGSLRGTAVALGLCTALFAGPLLLAALDGRQRLPLSQPWNAARWRNLVVAPIAEEFVFRACLCPLLLKDGFSPTQVILGCPLFFGLAHVHHIWELHVVRGLALRSALASVGFQAAYTTVFGAFATLLLLQTGTLAAPVAAHCFCNYCGVPDFPRMLRHGPAVRLTLYVGVLTFFVALNRFCKIP